MDLTHKEFHEDLIEFGDNDVREVHNRFALQWLDRIQFDDVEEQPYNNTSYKHIKLMTGTTLLPVKSEDEIKSNGLLKFTQRVARERGFMDSFDHPVLNVKMDHLTQWIQGGLAAILGVMPRPYDIRVVMQMSCPRLWNSAKHHDYISNPAVDDMRLSGLMARASDDGVCRFMPEVLRREFIKYIEEHMCKEELDDRIIKAIDEKLAELNGQRT